MNTIDKLIKEIESNEVLSDVYEMVKENRVLEYFLLMQTSKGLEKYEHSVKSHEYSIKGWCTHAIQEGMDKMVYISCLTKKHGLEQKEIDTLNDILEGTLKDNIYLSKLWEKYGDN